ncbi:uncharacterized protein EV422DRAFT_342755 [Fimicolochytrium jonesii]|uniref:uncharacterized protein n=1 Tax=Fimicolochytrium jonesii TaxID=1396493 RepID=UPI0022FF361C|nr:uncharacterized protein EV422DRAFT_342755 [Fimicolochytrium jonesii]KAI8815843.1 hypothetical protein EV422DRAFT_342755 [Fimicolochytrium jonesii]
MKWLPTVTLHHNAGAVKSTVEHARYGQDLSVAHLQSVFPPSPFPFQQLQLRAVPPTSSMMSTDADGNPKLAGCEALCTDILSRISEHAHVTVLDGPIEDVLVIEKTTTCAHVYMTQRISPSVLADAYFRRVKPATVTTQSSKTQDPPAMPGKRAMKRGDYHVPHTGTGAKALYAHLVDPPGVVSLRARGGSQAMRLEEYFHSIINHPAMFTAKEEKIVLVRDFPMIEPELKAKDGKPAPDAKEAHQKTFFDTTFPIYVPCMGSVDVAACGQYRQHVLWAYRLVPIRNSTGTPKKNCKFAVERVPKEITAMAFASLGKWEFEKFE